jgi:cholest-4-en-3-one 26-monooxygenase
LIEGLNLLDGSWYGDDPHAVWTELRRESPVHYDPASDVWGISKYADVLAIEKDPKTFSSHRAPRPHGDHLPMMISIDDARLPKRASNFVSGLETMPVAFTPVTPEG